MAFLGLLFLGHKLVHIQRIISKSNTSRPAAHAHEPVVHVSGWSTKTATNVSKKLFFRKDGRPLSSSMYLPSKINESVHATLVSFGSKHSQAGRTVPLTSLEKLHLPRPAQLTGQYISGHALLNLGHVRVVEIVPPATLTLILSKSWLHVYHCPLTLTFNLKSLRMHFDW